MLFACTFGRRMNITPVHIDDTINTLHQKALLRTIVFGNDHTTFAGVGQLATTNGFTGIENGQGATANMRHATHNARPTGDARQGWALQHFFDFKDVDTVDLLTVEPK